MEETNTNSTPSPSANAGVSGDIKDFHNLHPNKKLAVFGVIAVVLIISIAAGSWLARMSGQNKDGGTATDGGPSTIVPAEGTNLMMTSTANSMEVGETVTVTVALENIAVQATDVAIMFDPTMFVASDIVNGTVYDDILRSEIADGKVLVSAAVGASNPQDLRTGELFSFTLEALKAGEGVLTYDPVLTITAKNGVNTIGKIEPLAITVK